MAGTSRQRPSRSAVRSCVQDMNEQARRETGHQDAPPTPRWLSRELQSRARVPWRNRVDTERPIHEERNIPELAFPEDRDSYMQLLTPRWCNTETPPQLINFMSVQDESVENPEYVIDERQDIVISPRAGAEEYEPWTVDQLELRRGTPFQAGHNHNDQFSTVQAEHGRNHRVVPTLSVLLNVMTLPYECRGDEERNKPDSQHDVHPRVHAGENEDLLDLTLRLGRTCEGGYGDKISANHTRTAPGSPHQRVHNSLDSTPQRPLHTLNLLRR